MNFTHQQSPSAAAFPPSAAAPAAGIASPPEEVPSMPAASFLDAPVRQWAIGPKQCRWILADEDRGAEALMCGAPAERHRLFCAAHCALAYVKPAPDEGDAGAEQATTEVKDPENRRPNASGHYPDQSRAHTVRDHRPVEQRASVDR
jgi:hypothetical protein